MNTAQPCERGRTARREVEGEGGWKGRTRQEPNAHQERAVVERCNGSAEKSNEDEAATVNTTDVKRRSGVLMLLLLSFMLVKLIGRFPKVMRRPTLSTGR